VAAGAAASPAVAGAAAEGVAPGEPLHHNQAQSSVEPADIKEISMTWIIVIVVLVVVVGFVVVGFNKLRSTDVGAQEALGGIDVQLTRRADLIPNLVETVKGYAAHEKGVLEEVTDARAKVQEAAKSDDVPAKAAADAQLTGALANINAVAENYPDLKANQNFLDLQKQLADTENQISFARQYYNDAVATLNKLTSTIPWMFFTGIANVHSRDFYQAPEGQDQAPEVHF
jgi:LemA protein